MQKIEIKIHKCVNNLHLKKIKHIKREELVLHKVSFTIIPGYFEIGNLSCRIISDASLYICKIFGPAISMARPYCIHVVSGHHRSLNFSTIYSFKLNAFLEESSNLLQQLNRVIPSIGENVSCRVLVEISCLNIMKSSSHQNKKIPPLFSTIFVDSLASTNYPKLPPFQLFNIRFNLWYFIIICCQP